MKVALTMILYNEEKVLLRCLNSVLPLIDYYIIVDTGSTDKTKIIAKDFFEEKDIPGEIHDAPNFNMSENLNFAFGKLKENKIDFAFYIDADNILSIPEKFNAANLKKELEHYHSGMITVKSEDNEYGKRLFYNLSHNWTWQGVIHEVATCEEEKMITYKSNLQLIIHNDGNSWTSQSVKEKYLRHADIILKDIELNGMTSRNVFYLAQSYRDAGEHEKAIEWYSKRLPMMGFYEEVYVSQLNIAILKWTLNKSIMEVADEFMYCNELDSLRAEHLYHLKLMYERNGRPKCAAKIHELLKTYKNPYPKRMLFLNPNAYI